MGKGIHGFPSIQDFWQNGWNHFEHDGWNIKVYGYFSNNHNCFFKCWKNFVFFDVSKFDSDTNSIIYLISSALGNFDYTIFTTNNLFLSKYYGYAYQSLFLLMVSIVLLNFLVAILADIYTILQLQAKGLHSRQILLMRSGYDDDPYYSSLVLLPVPLNIFMIPFIPFIILFKSKKLNQALIYLCYFPVLVLSMLTFTVGNLIFMPIAYFITILKIWMKGIKTQFDIKSLIYVAAELVLFIFFGLFYFLFTISLDVLRFLVSLFEKDKNMPKNSKVIKEIAQLDYNFLKVLIEVLSSYDSQEVETKKIINMLQKKLKIIEQIIEILYKRPTKRKINDGILYFYIYLESNLDIENTKNISIADPDASSIKINVNIPQKSLKNLDNLQIRCEVCDYKF